ncbi:hypothetical protein BRSPCE3_43770 [Bradyrhizobium sp. Ce-3]|nr:hypothetical protein BRSPCE3_43770 [Bradyrhizobium sp. Ce-3]
MGPTTKRPRLCRAALVAIKWTGFTVGSWDASGPARPDRISGIGVGGAHDAVITVAVGYGRRVAAAPAIGFVVAIVANSRCRRIAGFPAVSRGGKPADYSLRKQAAGDTGPQPLASELRHGFKKVAHDACHIRGTPRSSTARSSCRPPTARPTSRSRSTMDLTRLPPPPAEAVEAASESGRAGSGVEPRQQLLFPSSNLAGADFRSPQRRYPYRKDRSASGPFIGYQRPAPKLKPMLGPPP